MNVVCFKWRSKQVVSKHKDYDAKHVNALNRMLNRCVSGSYQLHCVTDDPRGLDSGINAVALPDALVSLTAQFPKIMLFSREMEVVVGERFLYMDLDVVVTGNIDHLFPDKDVEFKVLARSFAPTLWQRISSKKHRRQGAFYGKGIKYNTSMIYCRAGARANVYENFDADKASRLRKYYMVPGSDQTWVYYCLGPSEDAWTTKDGVFSYGSELNRRERREVPADVKLVFFGGARTPWDKDVIKNSPWIEEHYPTELL